MGKPQPENYRTAAEYRWAMRLWRRRTGGSLLGTFVLAALVGGLSGSATLAIITIVVALGVHLTIRARS